MNERRSTLQVQWVNDTCLLADMYVDHSLADAALDLAAPVEPTAAAFQCRRAERVVAAPTAQ